MLWFIRRPLIRRWQRFAFYERVPVERREKSWEHFKAQNRWASKHGLKLITFLMNLLFASIIINVTYYGMEYLFEEGFLSPLHK
ncbi:MAG: hypothetical protein JSS72_08975 [Armatimonadetes bacterium]|nr:hypothetical protein [Armatimonadota bacterium]